MGDFLTKIKKWLLYVAQFFYKIRTRYDPLDNERYLNNFGVKRENENAPYKVVDEQRLLKAYEKAWENRNFEIDKFWARAAYFWGFIVLIFGGYASLLTSEHNEKVFALRLDLYLLQLGFLFSLSWWLVILGSKCWQQNWEAHIDHLEDYISGPIYKTIYYSGNRFYSVSKLNEVMAIAVFLVWTGLLGQYMWINFNLTFMFSKIDIQATVSTILTTGFACSLAFGYSLGDRRTVDHRFIDRWE
jgi:hypothetical protein